MPPFDLSVPVVVVGALLAVLAYSLVKKLIRLAVTTGVLAGGVLLALWLSERLGWG